MIKHTLSFHIDNSQEDWICVHTPIPDYQMAYHINKAMPVHLKRRGEDFSAKDNGERYPIFSYQNKKKGVHWHLISNKMKSADGSTEDNLLFSSAETHYLFKQLTGVDYLLSVGNEESQAVQKKLAQIPDVQSCYSLPTAFKHLKQQLSF